MQKITIVAALDAKYGIGLDNNLPWHIPADLKQFKAYTNHKPMIMGRKSFESLGGKPLPNRPTTVISKKICHPYDDIKIAQSAKEAIANYPEAKEIIIAGGYGIYKECLSICTHMRLTHINATYKTDTLFPKFIRSEFLIEKQTPLTCEANPNLTAQIITYKRIDIPSSYQ